jgi:asparagine synthetase B (glutamine-hydrolysing)
MCGFGVSNIPRLQSVNQFSQKRGPDLTTVKNINGIQFLHNLLHITGDLTTQPFVDNDIACVYNGEIYNHSEFGSYKSDGECLIDLYKEHGESFVNQLDGEFAICLVDFKNQKVIIAVDTFSCKPLWYEFSDSTFCIGSYNSQLTGLGFKQGQKLKANSTLVFNLKTLKQVTHYENKTFDLKQHKTSFDDWELAFSKSIEKRTLDISQGLFIGLSSGYDSGSIACELEKQHTPFKAYTITNNENSKILEQRFKLIADLESFELSSEVRNAWVESIKDECEDFIYNDDFKKQNIKTDMASYGLCEIFHRANAVNRKIYLSGHGADEIVSDYGFDGKKIYNHSEFGGKFPKDLHGFFPWHKFYDGTQIQFLNKEEYIAGHFGIETRYPFLDNNLVQEFLWLDSKLKNSKYKSCISHYLTNNNFPVALSEKRGFNTSVPKRDKVKEPKAEIIYPEVNPDITVCTFATRGYMKYAAQLEQDCKKFGYKFHNYVLDIEDPKDIQEIYFQQPAHKLKAVKEFGRIIWLDAESRILKPFPDYWTDGTYQIIRARREFISGSNKKIGKTNGGFLIIDERNKKYLEDVCRTCLRLDTMRRETIANHLESYNEPLPNPPLMLEGGSEPILDAIFYSVSKFTDKSVFHESMSYDRFLQTGQSSKILRGEWPSNEAVIAHSAAHRLSQPTHYSRSWVLATITNNFVVPAWNEQKHQIIIDQILTTVVFTNRDVKIVSFYINGKEHTYKQSQYRKKIWDKIAKQVTIPVVHHKVHDIYEFNNWYFSQLHGWPKEEKSIAEYQEWLPKQIWNNETLSRRLR